MTGVEERVRELLSTTYLPEGSDMVISTKDIVNVWLSGIYCGALMIGALFLVIAVW